MATQVPGPGLVQTILSWHRMEFRPWDYLADLQARYGDLVHVRFPGLSFYLLSDPESAREVLKKTNSSFDKQTRLWNIAKAVGGEGITTSEGSLWKEQRSSTRQLIPTWIPLPMNFRYKWNRMSFLKEVALLAHLSAKDSSGESIIQDISRTATDDAALLAETANYLGAGVETTSTAAIWAMLALLRDKRILHAASEEAGRSDWPLQAHRDLQHLPLISAIVDWAISCYPALWGTSRRALEEVDLLGYRIPRGAEIMMSLQSLNHREHSIVGFEDLSLENLQAVNGPGDFSFGYGPRSCSGKNMAILELTVLLTALLRFGSWQSERDLTEAPALQPSMRPRGPFPAAVCART